MKVQRLGFNGQRAMWFDDPQAPTVSLATARRYAFLRRFGNGAEYRIVNDDGEQLWSTQEE